MSQDKRRQSGFTRRKFMKSAAAGAASAAGGKMLATPAQAKTNQHPDPDVILINGKIHTMDAKNRIASSVAIKNGRFIEVVGHYNAQTEPSTIKLDEERIREWLAKGAQPTDQVKKLLKTQGIAA